MAVDVCMTRISHAIQQSTRSPHMYMYMCLFQNLALAPTHTRAPPNNQSQPDTYIETIHTPPHEFNSTPI